jgi:hypothetical protein
MTRGQKAHGLNNLMGMLVLRYFRSMVVHVQRVVVVMVVCRGLGVRHGVGQVGNLLLLTPRREPYQSLPQHGKDQKSGTAASRHAADSTDVSGFTALIFRQSLTDCFQPTS